MTSRFWQWYEKHYQFNLILSTALFLLQLFHLYWMASHVLGIFFFQKSFFIFPQNLSWLYALVDYTEIPALISVGLIYVHDLQNNKTGRFKNWLYLFFLNIQWVHLFWITDEIVLANFTGTVPVPIPRLLAFGAIIIDFLELPVMIETSLKAIKLVLDSEVKSWHK